MFLLYEIFNPRLEGYKDRTDKSIFVAEANEQFNNFNHMVPWKFPLFCNHPLTVDGICNHPQISFY